MGILGTIINKVFGGKKEAAAAPASATAPAEEVIETVVAATPAVPADFDVSGYLNELRGQTAEKLDWTVSIVDLMAKELGYGEDMKDSAKMNIWLHKQVMQQIAKHGGKLPAELIA